ncbi:NUDIX hydrolase YfcD [Desulfogranum japonicum]|uniref:NUDIX hydrolase YfcD n=1 Tax=Desulfogranum japonicum TaxID=231447 RepID=UPI00040BD0A3|nr:NUDIX hydrolase YfcD [Desulfogranum japonicum]
MSANELIQIVDRSNKPIGSAMRGEMREKNLIHRATYILVFNNQEELFIQKRTAIKDIYPSHWDVAAGGVVLADEPYEEAAKRELSEELGISNVPLIHLCDNYFEEDNNRVWGRIYSCLCNGPFILQEEEIEYGRFIALQSILPLHADEPFTPDGIQLLQKLGKI